jgi:hypothetical protein
MQQFMRKFAQLNGIEGRVILEHCLFDGQRFYCRNLQTINDDKRIGVVLQGHKIFMDMQDIKVAEEQDNEYILSDGSLTITIICK